MLWPVNDIITSAEWSDSVVSNWFCPVVSAQHNDWCTWRSVSPAQQYNTVSVSGVFHASSTFTEVQTFYLQVCCRLLYIILVSLGETVHCIWPGTEASALAGVLPVHVFWVWTEPQKKTQHKHVSIPYPGWTCSGTACIPGWRRDPRRRL